MKKCISFCFVSAATICSTAVFAEALIEDVQILSLCKPSEWELTEALNKDSVEVSRNYWPAETTFRIKAPFTVVSISGAQNRAGLCALIKKDSK